MDQAREAQLFIVLNNLPKIGGKNKKTFSQVTFETFLRFHHKLCKYLLASTSNDLTKAEHLIYLESHSGLVGIAMCSFKKF